MASSLSNFVDNLAEEIHKIKCKYSDCFLEYESVEDNLIKYVCLCFNEDYLNKLNEKLKKKKNLRSHLSFVIMISINLFCC